MQLSIIIVNFNVKYFLEQCLYSVIKACKNINVEVFVVDNNSTDGSKDFFKGKFSPVTFIWNKENVGFAKANNQVIQECSGEYILFLNPDTIIPEDCFEKCIAFLQSKENNGALGIHMIDGAGKFLKESKRGFPSPQTSLFKLSGLTGLFPHSKTFAHYYLGHLNENTTNEVDVLAGAFMLIPKRVLDVTGSFDETFFMYGEDIDLSYRVQKAGFKNYYFAGSTIIHFKGESTSKQSIDYVRHFYKAMTLFVNKHYSSGNSRIFNTVIQFAIFIKASISVLSRIFRSTVSFFTNLFHQNKKINLRRKMIVVGDENSITVITALLQNAVAPAIVIGRVSNTKSAVTNSLSDLPGLLKRLPATDIIFCENGFSFKDIISEVQQLDCAVNFMFHASGSSSIVGSNDKNASGFYIAAI